MPDGEPQPEKEKKQDTGRNPGAGCIIIILAMISLAFLIGFAIWNLFKLDKELSKFTELEARHTPVPDLVEHAEAVNVLNSKIETFTTDEGNAREASLTLTPEEINLALAAFDEFKDLRTTFHVKSIEDGKVYIEISFPLRGSPTKGGFRYLNGTLVATPKLTAGEIVLDVERVDVPGKTVPDGFIGQLSPYRFTQRYLEDETLGPWMTKLTTMTVSEGAITLTITPGVTPPAEVRPPVERRHVIRTAVVFGLVLIGFIGLALYAAKRGRQMTDSA